MYVLYAGFAELKLIAQNSVSGPDPNTNARLASIISSAKRVGFPKASIEAAIARGQGISSSRTELESVTIEALLPPSVAVVIDCQTDNKSRTLQDVRLIIKEHDGTVTPTSYLFTKAGKLVFQSKEGINAEMALEAILDFGVIDAFEEEGRIVILTEPNQTSRVLEVLESQFGLQIGSSDIIWTPNQDTMVTCAEETAFQNYTHFLDEIQGVSDVQAVHTNAMWKIAQFS
ncbi:MAG: Translational activator of mitochondrially encoded cytochrome c oxidase I [Bathelium mastoideum]|nr:MAG: Translational activator of mitochondrially encoded cytochrome c oxidase I [Bathelium mastoideum]